VTEFPGHSKDPTLLWHADVQCLLPHLSSRLNISVRNKNIRDVLHGLWIHDGRGIPGCGGSAAAANDDDDGWWRPAANDADDANAG
jgi:hypothetical protein